MNPSATPKNYTTLTDVTFKDAAAQIRSIRDRQTIMRKLDELEDRINTVAKRGAAYDALLKAEAIFTTPDDPDDPEATRH